MAPSPDQLTSTTVRRLRRHAKSGHCAPCQNASTHGLSEAAASPGSTRKRTRRVASQTRATIPAIHPSIARAAPRITP
jgi:hypothetical protein